MENPKAFKVSRDEEIAAFLNREGGKALNKGPRKGGGYGKKG